MYDALKEQLGRSHIGWMLAFASGIGALVLTLAALSLGKGAGEFPRVFAASGGDFHLDFIAAQEDTYDHVTGAETSAGALQYGDRTMGVDTVEQLEAVDFICGDVIVYYTRITVDEDASHNQTIFLTVQFDAVNNGQHGAGYVDVINSRVGISGFDFAGQSQETGNINLDGDESVTMVPGSERFLPLGSSFGVDADELEVMLRVSGLDGGDQVIARFDVQFDCFAERVTGNMHGTLYDAFFDADGDVTTSNDQDAIRRGSGHQDIPMLGLGEIQTPTNTPGPTPTDTPPGPTPTDTPPGPTDTPELTPTDTPPGPTPTDTAQPTDTPPATPGPSPTDTPVSEAAGEVVPTPTSGLFGLPTAGSGGPGSGSSILLYVALAAVGAGSLALGYWRYRMQN